MSNFTLLGWVDYDPLARSLHDRLRLFRGEGGVRTLVIRGPRKGAQDQDDETAFADAPALADWPELDAVLAQIARTGEQTGGVTFARIFFEMVEAGAWTPWRREMRPYFQRIGRLRMGVRGNNASLVHSGIESVNILPGQVMLVNLRAPGCVMNLAEAPRIDLAVDVKT